MHHIMEKNKRLRQRKHLTTDPDSSATSPASAKRSMTHEKTGNISKESRQIIETIISIEKGKQYSDNCVDLKIRINMYGYES